MMNKETNIEGNMQGVVNAESGSTINQTINYITSTSFEEEVKVCKTAYSKPKDIYIKREIDKKIEEKLIQNKASILFVHGRGGIGKSTLLKEVQYKANIPSIRININDSNDIDMGEVLLDKSQTTIFNCPNFERIRNQLRIEKRSSDYQLVNALRKDFREYGLFIVDTFEKNININVHTEIHFSDKKFEDNVEKSMRFRDYLELLIYHFTSDRRVTFIIGGRTKLKDINKDRDPDDKYLSNVEKIITELSFEVFTLNNIRDYFYEFTKVNNFDMPSDGQLNSIEEVTKGNPLLIHSFAHVSKRYSSWEDIDFKEMKRKIEEDDKYGLLYYFTEKIASCTELGAELWKLVIPRVLTEDIVNIIFQKSSILNILIDAGLAFKKNNQYFLHDEVFIAITAHAKKEFKKNLLSWHDHEKVRAVHQKLSEFYKKEKFESCYHKMMMKEDFDFSLDGFYSMTKEDFIHHFLGSLFIGYDEKIRTCKDFFILDKEVMEEKVRKLMSEIEEILPQISFELYEKCLNDIGKGELKNGIYDIEYLNKLLDIEEYKEELTLYKFLGQVYQSKKLYTKERMTYINALRLNLDREDYYLYLLIGNTYFRENNDDEALSNYKLSLRLKEKAETYNNMGAIYQRQEKREKAIEFYKKSLAIKPSESTYISLSVIYYEKKNYDESLELLNKSIGINGFNETSYMNMANCYREKKKYSASLHYYQLALKLNPKNEYIYNNLGILLENQIKYKDAIKWYKEAININSNNEWFHSNLASVYVHLGNFNKAKDSYIKAIKINPKNALFYNSIGKVSLKQELHIQVSLWSVKIGNDKKLEELLYKDTISLHNKAIELEPKNIQFYMDLAYAYKENNDHDKAIEVYTKVIKLNPTYRKAFFERAGIYLDKKKDYKMALRLYDKLLIQNPKWNLAYLKLGDCHYNLKEYDKAIRRYDDFLKKIKNNYRLDVYDKLMKCHFYRREFKLMIVVFKAKRNKMILINKLHQNKFKNEIKEWVEDILENMEFFFMFLLGIGSIILLVYLVFLIVNS